jgi:2-octaprenyl-6-methoxyphenol hydroxylase
MSESSDEAAHVSVAYPIVVAGAGLTASAMALALGQAGHRCALISRPESTAGDRRPIALSESSRRILAELGAWEGLAPHAEPIEHIVVSEQGAFSKVRLHACDARVAAFGFVAEARHIHASLTKALGSCPNLIRHEVADVLACESREDSRWCRYRTDDGVLETRSTLLIAADGHGSKVRDLSGMQTLQRDHDQVALTARVQPRGKHERRAFERFTPEGPLALLPMRGGDCGLVWCMSHRSAERRAALTSAQFARELNLASGGQLGGVRNVEARAAFELRTRHAPHVASERLVLIGNAANQLHPVAGQGLNLGLRDVAALADVLGRSDAEADPGALIVTDGYVAARYEDHRRIRGATDGLVSLFSTRAAPVAIARRAGLAVLGALPVLQARLARRAMGLGLEPLTPSRKT